MAEMSFILAVALAAAFVLLVVGMVAVIIYYRYRLKESHRTLARFIKEEVLLHEMKNEKNSTNIKCLKNSEDSRNRRRKNEK